MSLEVTNRFKQLANCAGCSLNGKPCLMQAPPVEQRDIVVISQMPIHADVLANDAFDSRGGRLVRQLLGHLGFGIDRWTGTYSVLCVPPENQTPILNDIAMCNERLIAQVKSSRPKIVIAMGEIAFRAVSRTKAGSTSIRRGMPFWSDQLEAYVLPTHHPRFAMEQPSAFFELAADFQKLAEVLTWKPNSIVRFPEITHHVITDEAKAIQAVDWMLNNCTLIATDIETKGFNFKRDKIICMGFAWSNDTAIIFDKNIMQSLTFRPHLRRLLESTRIKWLWHNGKFDIKFLSWQHGAHARVDEDSMLKHYCTNERRGTHDLEQVAMELLYVDPWEHFINIYKAKPDFVDYEDIPKHVLHKYLGKDVCYTFGANSRLDNLFAQERSKGRNIDLLYQRLLIKGANAFAEIEKNGMHADQAYTAELVEYFEPLLEKYLDRLNVIAMELGYEVVEYAKWWTNVAMIKYNKVGKKAGKKPPNPTKPPKPKDGRLFNPGSHQQLKYVMYQLMGLPLYKKEMTGDKDARKWYLENIENELHYEFIITLDKYKKDSKAYSTYVLGLDKLVWVEDGKIHSSFNLHGTETGRLSSSDPNLHNIPRDSKIKNIFVAEPDDEYSEEFGEWVMLQADYSQAELRVLAVLGGAPWLQGVYFRDEDLHDAVSLEMYGPQFTKEDRVRAKAVNFGIPYGRTEFTLASEFKMPIKEAKDMIKRWFAPQPETKAFMDARRKEPLEGEIYTGPTGRQRFYGIITPENKNAIMNEAGNMPIQGTASDCTLESVIQLVEATMAMDIYRNEKRIQVAKCTNSVHDSIIFQVRAKYIQQLAQKIEEVMVAVPADLLSTDVPFKADFEVGYRWGSIKGYDYHTNTVSWEEKNADGSKKPVACTLDTFRKFRADTKAITSAGETIAV